MPGSSRTSKQQEFVRQYFLCNRNASEALRRAGYRSKNPHVDASKLLAKPSILALIQAEELQLKEKFEIKRDDIINELVAIAFGNIGDILNWNEDGLVVKSKNQISHQQLKYIDNIKFDAESGKIIGVSTLAKEKVKAIEVLMRMLGFDKPKETENAYEVVFREAIAAMKKEASAKSSI